MAHEHESQFLTWEEASQLEARSEREFALRCLAVGCLLIHQVQVGFSVIDFLVINPKCNTPTSKTKGTLVEVTLMSNENIDAKRIRRRKKDKYKVSNKTAARKKRQISAMEESGYNWTILYKENIAKMVRSGKSK